MPLEPIYAAARRIDACTCIPLPGWQVAADANTASQTYPDQSLYPVDSVPKVVSRINKAFQVGWGSSYRPRLLGRSMPLCGTTRRGSRSSTSVPCRVGSGARTQKVWLVIHFVEFLLHSAVAQAGMRGARD